MAVVTEQDLKAVFLRHLQIRFELDRKALLRNSYLTGKGGRNEQLKPLLEIYEHPWLIEAIPEVADMVNQLHSMITPEDESAI